MMTDDHTYMILGAQNFIKKLLKNYGSQQWKKELLSHIGDILMGIRDE